MTEPASLTEAFLSRATPHVVEAVDRTALGDRLAALVQSARAAWPRLSLAPHTFVGHLAERLARAEDPASALAALHGDDLFLACACAHAEPRALSEFRARYEGEVTAALSRLSEPRAFLDEVLQLLLMRSFVPQGDRPPKIAEYGGRGPLGAWVRVAAVRLAIDLRRREKKHSSSPPESMLDVLDPAVDPEIELLRSRYLQDFNAAFAAAFKSLERRSRNALRLQLIDGLGIDEIGALYHVHRSTAARWLVSARQTLVDETRRVLAERLRLTDSEFDSLMRVVKSQLDLGIQQLLTEDSDDEGLRG